MKPSDKFLLLLFGLGFWILGTIFYQARGPRVFESGAARYWINFVITPVVAAIVCIVILKWRHIAAADWASGALLIALPGMFGEALLLSNFVRFMPRMRLDSAGRYGAFLFAAYALFLTVAEIATLRGMGSPIKSR